LAGVELEDGQTHGLQFGQGGSMPFPGNGSADATEPFKTEGLIHYPAGPAVFDPKQPLSGLKNTHQSAINHVPLVVAEILLK
jgi:hypothetical protein